ncbi:hypothetical protein M0R45_019673 [Rubus argutus]|uniref:Uncharacterized protein n=1 Tax=Rubus argutus TaxID=59490 RepID=A0AAW1X6I3_RUBAR
MGTDRRRDQNEHGGLGSLRSRFEHGLDIELSMLGHNQSVLWRSGLIAVVRSRSRPGLNRSWRRLGFMGSPRQRVRGLAATRHEDAMVIEGLGL